VAVEASTVAGVPAVVHEKSALPPTVLRYTVSSLSQRRTDRTQTNLIEVISGDLRLITLAFEPPPGATLKATTVTAGPQQLTATATQTGLRVELTLAKEVTLTSRGLITSIHEFA